MGRTRKIYKYNIEKYVDNLLAHRMSTMYISEMIKLKYNLDVSHESIWRYKHEIYQEFKDNNNKIKEG